MSQILQRMIEYGKRFELPAGNPKLKYTDTDRDYCVITGEKGPTLLVLPGYSINKGWLTGSSSVVTGGKLSTVNGSMDSAYWCKHKQGAVGPMSREAAMYAALGQTRLLASESPMKSCNGSNNLAIWTATPTEAEKKLVPLIFGGTKQIEMDERNAFFKACWNEEFASLWPSEHDVVCYMILLTKHGNGRSCVTAFRETTVAGLLHRVGRWMERPKTYRDQQPNYRIRGFYEKPRGPGKQTPLNVPKVVNFIGGSQPPPPPPVPYKKRGIKMHYQLDRSCTDPNYVAGRQLAMADFAREKLEIEIPSIYEKSVISQGDVNASAQMFQTSLRQIKKAKKFCSLATTIEDLFPPSTGLIDGCEKSRAMLKNGYDHQAAYVKRLNFSKAHLTLDGQVVRSKIEKWFCDAFYRAGVTYLYEQPVAFDGDRKAKFRIPDITIFDRDNNPIYIELLGGAHNKDDDPNWDYKKSLYEANDCDLEVVEDYDGTMTQAEAASRAMEILISRGLTTTLHSV